MTDVRYELATLSCSPLGMADASRGARDWVERAIAGTLLGIWRSDIGEIGQLFLLRRFDNGADLAEERQRALESENPFGSADSGTPLIMESFAPFPFLPSILPRDYGGTFEFRTYYQTPGGLPGTIAAWRDAIAPARKYTKHLVINMYALDGSPRIKHIWGFISVAERDRLREEHYAKGLWPPRGGPERIAHATSTIARSEPGLPIH